MIDASGAHVPSELQAPVAHSESRMQPRQAPVEVSQKNSFGAREAQSMLLTHAPHESSASHIGRLAAHVCVALQSTQTPSLQTGCSIEQSPSDVHCCGTHVSLTQTSPFEQLRKPSVTPIDAQSASVRQQTAGLWRVQAAKNAIAIRLRFMRPPIDRPDARLR
jgi:hypothetical protein